MFFNTKKKQAEKLLNKQAKELADAILNTFKVGLFKTKYNPIDGKFTLPPTIFKDIYISGFIEHFISLNLSYIYNKDNRWTHDEIGDFVVNGYKNLNFTTEDIQLYTNLIIDENIRKDWNIDGRYTLGKEHARLCFCCMFNIFADNENSKLLPKAKDIAKNMPNILGDETYEIKLISAMCELTIYDYLRKQFGGVLIGKHDFTDVGNEKVETKVENTKTEKKQEIEEKKQESKKNESLSNDNDDDYLENEYKALKDSAKIKYESENILTDIFTSYRGLILYANKVSEQNKNSKNYSGLWITLVYERIKNLTELFTKLEKLKNEDYVYHIKELLLLEDSLTKVSQQKVYNEFKEGKWLDKLKDYHLFKELLLKDFNKLKKG